MPIDPRVLAIVEQAVELREQGLPCDLARLCADLPELLPEVEQCLRRLDAVNAMLGEPGGPPLPADELPIPGYEVVLPLGRGGMGVVYLAWEVKPRRWVALKRILGGAYAGSQALARFRHEAEALGRLQHPNIVAVHHAGEHQGQPFLVMEYVSGGPLDRRVGATPLAADEAARLVEILARAVHHAHQRGVIHRDLKPGNVLLACADAAAPPAGCPGEPTVDEPPPPPCVPKVSDFGLVKFLDEERQPTALTYGPVGTPAYMAPEQAAGRLGEVGTLSDVYSLGAVLYRLLTGRAPYRGESNEEILARVASDKETPPAPSKARAERVLALHQQSAKAGAVAVPLPDAALARDLELICLKCLEKEPARRYASAAALAEELRRHRAGEPLVETRPVGRVERAWRWCRRNRAVAGLLAAVALSLLVGAGFATYFAFEASARAADERKARDKEHEANLLATKTAAANAELARQKGEALEQAQQLSLNLAQELCEQGDVPRGLLRLTAALRLAEGQKDAALQRYLRANLAGWARRLTPLQEVFPHRKYVKVAAFSPDGTRILTGSGDGTAQVWDAATGKRLGKPLAHADIVNAAAFSPDGKSVVTGSDDNTACLWNAVTGERIGKILRHGRGVKAVAFGPDGASVLTGSWDSTARLWNAATGEPLGEPLPHPAEVYDVAFSPDGKVLLVGGGDGLNEGTARLWEVAARRPIGKPLMNPGTVLAAAFSPDGKRVVTAGFDGTARLWDAATGKPTGVPCRHGLGLFYAAFSPDGGTLLTTGQENTVQLWDAATGKATGVVLRHRGAVFRAAFSPDGKTVLTGALDGTARLWDAETGAALSEPLAHPGAVWTVAFSPDGRRLLTAAEDGAARLWEAAALRPIGQPLPHGQVVTALRYSPDGHTAFTGGADGIVRRWDAHTGAALGVVGLHPHYAVYGMAVSPDGKVLLVGAAGASGEQGEGQLWDVASGRLLAKPLPHDGAVQAVAFSPDGRTALTGSWDGAARLWRVPDGSRIGQPLRHGQKVQHVAFSPDGKVVVTAGDDGTARLWDAQTGRPLGAPLRHQTRVNRAAFSPRGDLVLTASWDKTARLWDVATGKPRGKPLEHLGDVMDVAFSPDGKVALTASQDRTARFWKVPSGEPLGLPLQHQSGVMAVAYHPGGTLVLTGTSDGTARLWDVTTRRPVGPPVRHRTLLSRVMFSPDGKTALTGVQDSAPQLWRVPTPLEGDSDRVALWAEVLTGLGMEADGGLRLLDADAWKARRRRLARQQGGEAEFPRLLDGRLGLARRLRERAARAARHRDLVELERALLRARALAESLATAFPDILPYREELTLCHYALGLFWHTQTGRHEQAEAALRKAADLAAALWKASPRNHDYQIRRALALGWQGSALGALDRWPEALPLSERGWKVARDLMDRFPEVPEYRYPVAICLNTVGLAQRALHDRMKAAQAFYAAQELLQDQVARFPEDSQRLKHLVTVLLNLCDILPGGHEAGAKMAPELAKKLLSGKWEGNWFQAAMLAGCVSLVLRDEELPKGKRGELAEEYGRRAVRQLDEAIKKGFAEAEELRADGAFEPLRTRADFLQLVGRLESRSP